MNGNEHVDKAIWVIFAVTVERQGFLKVKIQQRQSHGTAVADELEIRENTAIIVEEKGKNSV